jgi:uncharacterized peroxidase-related enzyme
MQRILALDTNAAPAASQPLLNAVNKQFGMVPNIFKTLAHSPASLQFALNQNAALSTGALSKTLREQIALVTAGRNRCDYCASAHTAIGGGAGLAANEMTDNLAGRASDVKVEAALSFAASVVDSRGQITDAELTVIRAAGYSDGEIIEILAHVTMNTFTNYFNHIAGTTIDFPIVTTTNLRAAA